MKKRAFPLPKVHTLLESGPVVLLSTSLKGKPNVMPMSWHSMIEFTPPLVGCVVSDLNFSFATLKKTKECVLSIPTVEIAEKVVACGNSSGRTIDKFSQFNLTPKPASLVAAPLIDECYANFECKLYDSKLVSKYGFFVFEVVKAWIDPKTKNPHTIHHLGEGQFMVRDKTIKIASKKK